MNNHEHSQEMINRKYYQHVIYQGVLVQCLHIGISMIYGGS